MDAKIILIGGAPTVGKSHLAKRLAEELKLPWISTDTVRGMMRKICKSTQFPALFSLSEDSDAVEYLTGHTAQQIVGHQNQESKEVWQGILGLISTDYVWQSFIVEGVAVLPEQVAELMKNDKRIRPIFLIDHDSDRLKNVIYTRGLWDDADKYPDSVKPKELEWVTLFNSWIESECAKYELPTIEVSADNNEYLAKIKELVA